MIIAIEGIDGAGKNTLMRALRTDLAQDFAEVDTLSFPRYDDSIHAQLAHEALHGRMGDLTASAYAMATLFALDRAGAKDRLDAFARGDDRVLLLDRYVASNAAYTAARTGDYGVIDWVGQLEYGRLELPQPQLQILLSTAPEEASKRARKREATDVTRTRDSYERDSDLQQATYEAYVYLAESKWAGQWVHSDAVDAILQEIRKL
ncbi:dTMP kinase [Corynebacterium cystitidis]|uniref:Thymidylate kinase n=1 Tax=Corynebacterium cystitidis DSM 20524 TaxID=1121357 RepID=A0A1H9QJ11_9CORY|nr:dTMP kinase [Corynebacterium cystitidis]WJY81782.1 Thymidylate kinase [Corynebacterium cystitidis DSM 20524]SER59839.1 dTMP kinase [Corynebacterium cystitidis DSM 20524]SNV83664.1 thymidylate kinase [Corynebacterium cystitidis]